MRVVRQNSRKANFNEGGQGSHLRDVVRQKIADDIRAGDNIGELASRYGVAKSTIYRIRASMVARATPAYAPTERVTFRLSKSEKETFYHRVGAEADFVRDASDALRLMVRNSVGLLDKNNAFVGELSKIYKEISAIGVNINQIAHAVNRGQAPPLRHAEVELKALRMLLMQTMPRINDIVLEARRQNEHLWKSSLKSDHEEEV